MKKIIYLIKLTALMLLMSMAAFGLVMPGNLNTRKRYADKEVTIELVESTEESTAITSQDELYN